MKILENQWAHNVETTNELTRQLKEFEMNDLWRAKSGLKLEIEYLNKSICWQKEEDEHLPLIMNFDDDDDYEEVWKTWWWCMENVEDLKECFDSRD